MEPLGKVCGFADLRFGHKMSMGTGLLKNRRSTEGRCLGEIGSGQYEFAFSCRRDSLQM